MNRIPALSLSWVTWIPSECTNDPVWYLLVEFFEEYKGSKGSLWCLVVAWPEISTLSVLNWCASWCSQRISGLCSYIRVFTFCIVWPIHHLSQSMHLTFKRWLFFPVFSYSFGFDISLRELWAVYEQLWFIEYGVFLRLIQYMGEWFFCLTVPSVYFLVHCLYGSY